MENNKARNKRAVWIGIAALLVLALAFVLLYNVLREQPVEGAKTITLLVVHKDGTQKSFTYDTDEEYLGAVLLKEGVIVGSEGAYGLYIEAVDGETVDSANQEWWCLTQDGEMCMTGVDTTPIQDGDHYEMTLTAGW